MYGAQQYILGDTVQQDPNDDILLLLKIIIILTCIYSISHFAFTVLFNMFR